jgi:hypothetical protein
MEKVRAGFEQGLGGVGGGSRFGHGRTGLEGTRLQLSLSVEFE